MCSSCTAVPDLENDGPAQHTTVTHSLLEAARCVASCLPEAACCRPNPCRSLAATLTGTWGNGGRQGTRFGGFGLGLEFGAASSTALPGGLLATTPRNLVCLPHTSFKYASDIVHHAPNTIRYILDIVDCPSDMVHCASDGMCYARVIVCYARDIYATVLRPGLTIQGASGSLRLRL